MKNVRHSYRYTRCWTGNWRHPRWLDEIYGSCTGAGPVLKSSQDAVVGFRGGYEKLALWDLIDGIGVGSIEAVNMTATRYARIASNHVPPAVALHLHRAKVALMVWMFCRMRCFGEESCFFLKGGGWSKWASGLPWPASEVESGDKVACILKGVMRPAWGCSEWMRIDCYRILPRAEVDGGTACCLEEVRNRFWGASWVLPATMMGTEVMVELSGSACKPGEKWVSEKACRRASTEWWVEYESTPLIWKRVISLMSPGRTDSMEDEYSSTDLVMWPDLIGLSALLAHKHTNLFSPPWKNFV